MEGALLLPNKMNSGIYEIRNIVNGNRYIGSSVDLNRRLKVHLCLLNKGMHTNAHLQSAWDKYGEDSFNFEVLELCEEDQVLEREQWYIDNGSPEYNMAQSVSAPFLGMIHTTETRKRISEIQNRRFEDLVEREKVGSRGRGRKPSKEARQRMSESAQRRVVSTRTKQLLSERNLGENNPMYGKTHNEETRRTISERAKERYRDPAARQKISDALRGRVNGPPSIETRRRMSEAQKGKIISEKAKQKMSISHSGVKSYNHRPVERVCPDTGETKAYPFIKSVKQDGFSPSCVSHVCNGRRKHHRGFLWRFI